MITIDDKSCVSNAQFPVGNEGKNIDSKSPFDSEDGGKEPRRMGELRGSSVAFSPQTKLQNTRQLLFAQGDMCFLIAQFLICNPAPSLPTNFDLFSVPKCLPPVVRSILNFALVNKHAFSSSQRAVQRLLALSLGAGFEGSLLSRYVVECPPAEMLGQMSLYFARMRVREEYYPGYLGDLITGYALGEYTPKETPINPALLSSLNLQNHSNKHIPACRRSSVALLLLETYETTSISPAEHKQIRALLTRERSERQRRRELEERRRNRKRQRQVLREMSRIKKARKEMESERKRREKGMAARRGIVVRAIEEAHRGGEMAYVSVRMVDCLPSVQAFIYATGKLPRSLPYTYLNKMVSEAFEAYYLNDVIAALEMLQVGRKHSSGGVSPAELERVDDCISRCLGLIETWKLDRVRILSTFAPQWFKADPVYMQVYRLIYSHLSGFSSTTRTTCTTQTTTLAHGQIWS
uniref:Uncharacterized protein n=2 Tax=Amorphochlora amoebiformis TaxID=1561963 RepID=A0A7S0H5Y6_9EUKA|mmetsp:Transcript_32162/g.51795  ORF Transcript_32162/g.51795 Transcript_32162/m.51795 type:complete len:465 (+) Transcript_32162:99-1493(+)